MQLQEFIEYIRSAAQPVVRKRAFLDTAAIIFVLSILFFLRDDCGGAGLVLSGLLIAAPIVLGIACMCSSLNLRLPRRR